MQSLLLLASSLIFLGCTPYTTSTNLALSGIAPIAAPTATPVPIPVPTPTVYYVSPTGSDSNSGQSPALPWQTVAKVSASTFNAGEKVLFSGGASFTGCLSFSFTRISATALLPFTVGSRAAPATLHSPQTAQGLLRPRSKSTA